MFYFSRNVSNLNVSDMRAAHACASHLFRGWSRHGATPKCSDDVLVGTGAYVRISLRLYPKLTGGLVRPRPYSYSGTFDAAEGVDVPKHPSDTRQAVLRHIRI